MIQTAPTTLRIRLEAVPGGDDQQVWTLVTSRLREYLSAQGISAVTLERDPERPRLHPGGKFRHVWAELKAAETASQDVML